MDKLAAGISEKKENANKLSCERGSITTNSIEISARKRLLWTPIYQ